MTHPDGDGWGQHVTAHVAFLKRLINAGQIRVSGPVTGLGKRAGFIVMTVANIDEARALIEQDPFAIDKWAVVNASLRGEKRGVAMPLLLALGRKPVFLHDDCVRSLESLLTQTRGPKAPHPFYVKNKAQRADVVVISSRSTQPRVRLIGAADLTEARLRNRIHRACLLTHSAPNLAVTTAASR